MIVARHGESVFSARRDLNGDPTAAGPLTETGVAEARRLGELLRGERLDLCVTSGFPRVRQTADEALRGREVPRLELPELGDPRYGRYEGGSSAEYREWAWSAPATEDAPGGGESRAAIAARYARGFATVLARPEETVLVVCHQLPIAYLQAVDAGDAPSPRVPWVEYATPFRFDAARVAAAVERLAAWAEAPTW
jgi:broad specificity phosphatase PhoE